MTDELRPDMTHVEYEFYQASREWNVRRREVFERCNRICERCGQLPAVLVARKTFERKGAERLEDLEARCRACHDFVIARSDDDPRIARTRLEREHTAWMLNRALGELHVAMNGSGGPGVAWGHVREAEKTLRLLVRDLNPEGPE